MDLTGRVMNLNAFRVADSFWTGGELGAVKETEVSVEIGEKGTAWAISFELFNMFCASGKDCCTIVEGFKSLFCCVLARLS